jgi:hypothetical protein
MNNASEQAAEAAVEILRRIIDAAENSNQAGENAAVIAAAAPVLLAAVRASYAWGYCEHNGLGSFDARGVLCAHSEYLCGKAMALVEGRSFDARYRGRKTLTVWPYVALEESDEATAEALVADALEHERATSHAKAEKETEEDNDT